MTQSWTLRRINLLCLALSAVSMMAAAQTKRKVDHALLRQVNEALQQSVSQYRYLATQVPDDRFPRTFENSKVLNVGMHGWVSGFFPGALLYLSEFSNDDGLKKEANEKLEVLKPLQYVTNTHDLGFMMYCSYGNAYRIDSDNAKKEILVQSAKSLATRFNPKVGCIKSWNSIKSLDGKRMLNYPVIIDNMMNLELLFFASKVTGDLSFKNIAITHAENTMKNHLRPDYSSYHVVDYDAETGAVKSQETMQGYADNSTWSRGQAWGIYGFTMVYRETKDKRFLKAAQKMADYFIAQLPEDNVPYWDFNAGQAGYTPPFEYDAAKKANNPRDASAAAITASALIELSGYTGKKDSRKYLKAAEAMLSALLSPAYRLTGNEGGGFLLKHATGGYPGGIEVDVPLSYADYYFVEALYRYKNLSNK